MAEVNLWLLILCGMTGLLALLLTIRLQRLEAEPRLTLRDHFAAAAMQGELACQREGYEWGTHEKLATNSYAVADAMLRAREVNHG